MKVSKTGLLVLPIYFAFICAGKQPNIIIFLSDDLGWNDVSFHGSDQIPTPNIDRLANEGITLNKYYVQPVCTPSRGALLTGKYPSHLGLQDSMIRCGQPYGMNLSEVTMAQHLNKLGYQSHMVGKWHLGFFNKLYTPTYRGFETFYGSYKGRVDFYTHTHLCPKGPDFSTDGQPPWGLDWHDDVRGKLGYPYEDYGKYATDLITERAIKLISSRDQSKPLFLVVSYQAVHSGNRDDPLQAPIEDIYSFKNIWDSGRRTYAAMVKSMDSSVDKIMQALKDNHISDNSIVLFSTDNGGAIKGNDQNWATNTPLKGLKTTTWEGGVRAVGAIWGSMFKKNAGTVSTDLMHIVDWLPTFYEAAGGRVSKLGKIDGVSQYKTLTGSKKKSSRSEALINLFSTKGLAAYIWEDYKLIYNPVPNQKPERVALASFWYEPSGALPYSTYKFPTTVLPGQVTCGPHPKSTNGSNVCFSEKLQIQKCLYNLKTDPCEYYNLVDDPKYQGIVKKMDAKLDKYRKTEVSPLRRPNDPAADPKYHNYTWMPWREDPRIPPLQELDVKSQHAILMNEGQFVH